MTARIIDGKKHAAELAARVASAVEQVKREHGLTPGLAVVLTGDNPASAVYVRSKSKQVERAGMASFDHHLPASTTQNDLLALVGRLNADDKVHGILVQLPLPKQIDPQAVIASIDPRKDIDGFHPLNAGRLATGQPSLVPCTPLGCLLLAKAELGQLAGLEAVVIGRSNIVGKPMAQLLIAESMTVTVAHSKTRDLPAVARRADLLVAAAGKAEMVKGDWIKQGATVLDVGINRVARPGKKDRLVGDVAFEEAVKVADAITPVPGGVGPMTIACLLRNTLQAACAIRGVDMPAV